MSDPGFCIVGNLTGKFAGTTDGYCCEYPNRAKGGQPTCEDKTQVFHLATPLVSLRRRAIAASRPTVWRMSASAVSR